MPDISAPLETTAASIRRRILRLTAHKGVGHTGGSLSMVEIMTALYFHAMRVDPAQPQWKARDRFILSKGHTTPGYYSTLAERGFFSEDDLFHEYDEIDSHFQGHPDMTKTPGVDMSTGSLGQGLSVGIGMALGMARQELDALVYVLMGDGETQEGQVWEAAMFAGARKIKRLVAIVDCNRLQLTAPTADVLDAGPLAPRFAAFGWKTYEVDGHDLSALCAALDQASAHAATQGPACIIANTVKGKGVSFIENQVSWHSKAPSADELRRALEELDRKEGTP